MNPEAAPSRKKYVRAVGPRLRILLSVLLGLTAVLAANSVYLGAITFLEWLKGDPDTTYQNWFYMVMFGAHLGLGLALVLPVLVFGILHIKNSHSRPNRRAVKVGYLLFAIVLTVLVTGLLLTRADVFQFKNLGLKNPRLRSLAYWAHVITPLLAAWLYILHRLAGPRIQWRVGLRWSAAIGVSVLGMVLLHSAHPRKNQAGSAEGKAYFEPSLARTASGKFIPARTLMMDDYCQKCHEDGYRAGSTARTISARSTTRLTCSVCARPARWRSSATATSRPRAGAPVATMRCRFSAGPLTTPILTT